MQYVPAHATDALVLHLQALERTLVADQREKPSTRRAPRDIATKQTKMLVRCIAGCSKLKRRADAHHSDQREKDPP